MILGTAGHIDHGKTALVRALTGVDTDRLPEEKRRGITIDLGFAPLRLDDGTVVGVVDVPGHEGFVRTMLAGASGINLALLVIGADEGPMPQTREHLAILQLLGVPELVVALTKADLVAPDWLALVTEDARALLAGTPYEDAQIKATSAVTGAGVAELRDTIATAIRRLAAGTGAADDLFRLPVDRAFTVKGTGTVVTGTVWSGSLAHDAAVRILPAGTAARVRGIQSHGASVERVMPGTRAAIALAGVETGALSRGATLVADSAWEPGLVLRADLTLLPEAPELRPRTRVRFHLGTADVGARIIAAGGPVQGGSARAVRVMLDEAVVARGGDRFVLRSASPLATIGGGVVSDAHAPRRAKPLPGVGMGTAERLTLLVKEAGTHGLAASTIPVRVGVAPGDLTRVMQDAADVMRVGDRWYSAEVLTQAAGRIEALVAAHHETHPLETGMPRQDARSRLRLEVPLFDHLVGLLVSGQRLVASGAELRLPGKGSTLSDAQARQAEELVAALAAAGHEPPSVSELQERFGGANQARSLLKLLERAGRVVQVEEDRYYAPEAIRSLLAIMERGMAGKPPMAPAELREMLGFSRKFLIPFLEYCDKRGYTQRQGNGRVWRGGAPPPHAGQ